MPTYDLVQEYFAANAKQLPSKTADGSLAPARGSKYGEALAISRYGDKLHALLEEGSYWTLRNATPGTGIAGHAAPTTLDDTKPFFFLRNDHTASEGKHLFIDFIRTQVTAAGTGGTNLRAAVKVDKGATRYSSGGTQLTPVSANLDVSDAPSMTAYVGAVVAGGATADARLLGHALVRPVINVVGDTYEFHFGRGAALNSLAVGGTAISNIVVNHGPLIVPPQCMMLLHFFSASQSAASSHEWEMGLWVA